MLATGYCFCVIFAPFSALYLLIKICIACDDEEAEFERQIASGDVKLQNIPVTGENIQETVLIQEPENAQVQSPDPENPMPMYPPQPADQQLQSYPDTIPQTANPYTQD